MESSHKLFRKRLFTILFSSVFILSSCSNIFKGMSRQDSDEALYEEALKAMNALDWDMAISKFQLMSTSFLATTTVRENYAGALAGRCGLNFASFLTTLQASSPSGSVTTLQWLMSAFAQKIVYPTSCVAAEYQIKLLGNTASVRTTGQNLFMVFLALVKIGTTLRNRADVDGTDSLGNGSVDSTFNACTSNAGGAGVLTDAEIAQVVSGLGLAIENAASLPSGVSIGTSLTALLAVCGASCNITDASLITPAAITVMRNLLATSANTIGIGGLCPTSNPVQCCP